MSPSRPRPRLQSRHVLSQLLSVAACYPLTRAYIQADQNSGNPLELQERTVTYIKRRHHDSDNPPPPHEPGVTTESMQNGEAPTQASYPRDEIDGPLKTAHGSVVEEVEYKEDVITRKAAA